MEYPVPKQTDTDSEQSRTVGMFFRGIHGENCNNANFLDEEVPARELPSSSTAAVEGERVLSPGFHCTPADEVTETGGKKCYMETGMTPEDNVETSEQIEGTVEVTGNSMKTQSFDVSQGDLVVLSKEDSSRETSIVKSVKGRVRKKIDYTFEEEKDDDEEEDDEEPSLPQKKVKRSPVKNRDLTSSSSGGRKRTLNPLNFEKFTEFASFPDVVAFAKGQHLSIDTTIYRNKEKDPFKRTITYRCSAYRKTWCDFRVKVKQTSEFGILEAFVHGKHNNQCRNFGRSLKRWLRKEVGTWHESEERKKESFNVPAVPHSYKVAVPRTKMKNATYSAELEEEDLSPADAAVLALIPPSPPSIMALDGGERTTKTDEWIMEKQRTPEKDSESESGPETYQPLVDFKKVSELEMFLSGRNLRKVRIRCWPGTDKVEASTYRCASLKDCSYRLVVFYPKWSDKNRPIKVMCKGTHKEGCRTMGNFSPQKNSSKKMDRRIVSPAGGKRAAENFREPKREHCILDVEKWQLIRQFQRKRPLDSFLEAFRVLETNSEQNANGAIRRTFWKCQNWEDPQNPCPFEVKVEVEVSSPDSKVLYRVFSSNEHRGYCLDVKVDEHETQSYSCGHEVEERKSLPHVSRQISAKRKNYFLKKYTKKRTLPKYGCKRKLLPRDIELAIGVYFRRLHEKGFVVPSNLILGTAKIVAKKLNQESALECLEKNSVGWFHNFCFRAGLDRLLECVVSEEDKMGAEEAIASIEN